MATHEELVAEMVALEQMGTHERQKLAKKRRMQQLKKWAQREKEWLTKEKQLNKRLANILNEENNGLNLKQYTTYNSNQRNKKKTLSNADNNNSISNGNDKINHSDAKCTNNNYSVNNNNSLDRPPVSNLTPNGRVHFNVGVMLLEAAARNDYEEVKRLLSLGVSPDSVNHDGLTALHQCCIDASEDIMNLLLEYGANVDARDTERWTPLHAACTCGHLNLVKILVEHGADLLAVNGDGNMPFDISEDEATLDYIESQMLARGVTQEMIDLTRASTETKMMNDLEKLVADGCDPNPIDNDGVSLLHIAAANNYLSVVKFLLELGVDVNVCDNDLWRPLHGVACWGNEQHIKILELLVDSGANLDARTSNDETVFDLCDNIDLLEKMNQLKDELDAKQASGTGRLKRSQSKTNSRVHSVRRTSVRDKNQISRREAREEALLRVESNEGLNIDGINGHNSEQQNLAVSESSDTQSDTSPSKMTDLQSKLHDTLLDQVDGEGPTETNLDLIDQTRHANEQVETVQENCTAIGSDHSIESNTKAIQRSQQKQIKPGTDDNNCNSNGPQSSEIQLNETKNDSETSMISEKDDQLVSLPTKATNRDLIGGLPAHSKTIVQVHLAPMNYTLSNLKKHRSDLRMRSVGSFSTSTTHTTIVKLDDSPGVDVGGTNWHSPSSPGTLALGITPNGASESTTALTFRKFTGEPSEVIEATSIRKHHKCCVIL